MANGLPYFRWFPADAQTDQEYAAMTDAELGFFHRCLNHSWINGGLPCDLDELARAMKVKRNYLNKVWDRVGRRFECIDGKLVNPRQEQEREHATKKSGQATDAVRTRYGRSSSVDTDVLPRAQARADSDSVSGSISEKEKKNESVLTDSSPKKLATLQPWQRDESYMAFKTASESNGCAFSGEDWGLGHAAWRILDPDQRQAAIDCAKSADGAFMALPVNYLRGHHWERKRPQPKANKKHMTFEEIANL